jgi:hypothetical protein
MSEYIRDLSLRGKLSCCEGGTFNMDVVKSKRVIYAGRMIFDYLCCFCKLFRGVGIGIKTSLHLLLSTEAINISVILV